MPTVYINIGSNIGDRHAQIERAVARIAALEGVEGVRCSTPYESEPWGFASAHRFINVGVAFESALPPLTILDHMQRIEREIADAPHRNPDGTYRDRPIDIDIIAIGRTTLVTPGLTLPHPRAGMRDFVMVPLRELAPAALTEWIVDMTITPANIL